MSGQMDDAPTPTPQATANPLFIDTGAFYARMDPPWCGDGGV